MGMTADLSLLGTEIEEKTYGSAEGEKERLGKVVPTSPLFIEANLRLRCKPNFPAPLLLSTAKWRRNREIARSKMVPPHGGLRRRESCATRDCFPAR